MSFCFFMLCLASFVHSVSKILVFCLCYVSFVFLRRPSGHFRFSFLLCEFYHREIEIKYYKK